MNTVLSPLAFKYINRLNEPDKSRIMNALKKLESEPPQGDIKNLAGRNGYRLRVGKYRILFDIIDSSIVVHAIAPRGQAY
jgi:mRNA interferase RelE/StbE